MPASEILERIDAVIASVSPHVAEPTRSELDALAQRLREPARVAVVGRVKAGKSTLVNALLGQRVAPTDVSECTRLVTWFRFGHPQRIEVSLRDGSKVERQLTVDGMLPAELGVPVESVSAIHVYLANEALRDMTLIDTPGIGSVNREFSSVTEEFLATDSAAATASADAVVFMLNQVLMADELEVLAQFQQSDGDGPKRSAANAVGVLSRADQLGDGSRDSWEIALELADRYAGTLHNEVATVVPVIGLVAETSEAATLTEHDVMHLSALAAMEEKAFSRLMWSGDRFVSGEAPVSEEIRSRLMTLLDLYGIAKAVALLRSGTTGAVGLRRQLSALAGIAEVKRTLTNYFRDQDHVLKARSALDVLRKLSFSPTGNGSREALERLRSDVEALQLDPVMHPILELETLHDCCTGKVELAEESLAEIRRLFAPGSIQTRLGVASSEPDVLLDAARQAMGRWRTFMVTEASPAQARVARVVLRSYQLAWERVKQ